MRASLLTLNVADGERGSVIAGGPGLDDDGQSFRSAGTEEPVKAAGSRQPTDRPTDATATGAP